MRKCIFVFLTFFVFYSVNAQETLSPTAYKGIPWGTSLQNTTDYFTKSGDSLIVAEGTTGCYLSKYLDYEITVFCTFTESDELAAVIVYFDRDKIKPDDTYSIIEKDLINQYGKSIEKHDYTKEKDKNREKYIKDLDPLLVPIQDERFTKWIIPNGDEIKLSLSINKSLSIQYSSKEYKFIYDSSKKKSSYIRKQ